MVPPENERADVGRRDGKISKMDRPILPGKSVPRRYEPIPSIQDQYWSALMTSPPARLPKAHQVAWPIVSLTNFTEPSPMATLTPPGWLLVALIAARYPPFEP